MDEFEFQMLLEKYRNAMMNDESELADSYVVCTKADVIRSDAYWEFALIHFVNVGRNAGEWHMWGIVHNDGDEGIKSLRMFTNRIDAENAFKALTVV